MIDYRVKDRARAGLRGRDRPQEALRVGAFEQEVAEIVREHGPLRARVHRLLEQEIVFG